MLQRQTLLSLPYRVPDLLILSILTTIPDCRSSLLGYIFSLKVLHKCSNSLVSTMLTSVFIIMNLAFIKTRTFYLSFITTINTLFRLYRPTRSLYGSCRIRTYYYSVTHWYLNLTDRYNPIVQRYIPWSSDYSICYSQICPGRVTIVTRCERPKSLVV